MIPEDIQSRPEARLIGAFSFFFRKRHCSSCLSAIVAVLLVTLSMNGAVSVGVQRTSLVRAAVPDKAGQGTAPTARLAMIVPDVAGQFFALLPLTYKGAHSLSAATNAWFSAVAVGDFPLSSLSRGPPDYRF